MEYHTAVKMRILFGVAILFLLVIQTGSTLKCYCSECGVAVNYTCETDGRCRASVEEREGKTQYSCVDHHLLSPIQRPFICEPTRHVDIMCCIGKDYCNKDYKSKYLVNRRVVPDTSVSGSRSGIDNNSTTPLTAGPGEDESRGVALIIALSVSGVTVLIMLIGIPAFLLRRRKRIRQAIKRKTENDRLIPDPLYGSQPSALHTDSGFSGSGAGQPMLSQRTVARQINLATVIGKGRFGEVWLAFWHGEQVAVKIFDSRDDKSWKRETEIYNTTMLRHENLLGFIAADNKDTGLLTQLWLITDYHEKGSLFDYLLRTTVDLTDLIRLTYSIANGLAHLHMEIVGGLQGKPAIAHRDLKSKNILVKRNGQCVIADLGLAVRFDSNTGLVDIPVNDKVGTNRYLAPEVLDDSINVKNFESFKAADLYALGLVYWEICRRCNVAGPAEEYRLPYYDVLPDDPTLLEVQDVVCVLRQRPPVSPSWQQNTALQVITRVMRECWYENPLARLTALRVRKTLGHLKEQLELKF